jgi:N-acetylmuramoyl-L-alanine amidase
MIDAPSALNWLCNPESKVSCHYFVDETGKVTQLVPEAVRAHHAGVSSWEGTTDINSRSIGIEIVNPGHEFGYRDFPEAQIVAVTELSWDIVSRNKIETATRARALGRRPGTQTGPGRKFPWEELSEAGIGHWIAPVAIGEGALLQPGDSGPAVSAMQAALRDYGYGQEISGTFDDATVLVVAAFQRHFRPARVDGIADHSTTR